MEATIESLLLNIALVLAISTAQRIFAIKIRRTKTRAAISQDYLLGGCVLRTQAENFESSVAKRTKINLPIFFMPNLSIKETSLSFPTKGKRRRNASPFPVCLVFKNHYSNLLFHLLHLGEIRYGLDGGVCPPCPP